MEYFKIFFGNYRPGLESNQADYKLNQWLYEHLNVKIIDWQYQQARMGDHSICIRYVEEEMLDPGLEDNERYREE